MSKSKLGTKVLSVFMSVVLAVGLMPLPAYAGDGGAPALAAGGALQAQAGDVSYVERSWDGSKVVETGVTRDDASPVPSDGKMTSGWYYLDSDVTVKGRVCLEGDTNLILGDGKTLNVKGLYIPKGKTLSIYAQSDGKSAGKIVSRPSSGSGIGAYSGHKGGNVVVHGGDIDAKGYDHCAGIGGNDDDRKDIGSFTMYAGKVTATGGESGAGIGGGRACEGGSITIYGGEVIATGGHYGAGIGGGNGQDTNPMRGAHGGTIKIYGGTVTATGGDDGAGIGGGEGGNAGTIEISGDPETTKVTAIGGNNSAGIGCGEGESTGVGGTVTITGGKVTATGGGDAAGIGGGEDGHCATITISGTPATTNVTATGGANGAGIGAGRDADGGNIRIFGGTVTATGTDSSAGIGGGDASGSYVDYSDIEITGGIVTATGSSKGAGIGGGEYGHATVTITGGTINATGGPSGGAGIGNGKDGRGSAITLGYTEDTQDSISITAGSFDGIVKLNQPFKNNADGRFRATSSVSDLNALAANPPLKAWLNADEAATSANVSSWAGLQEAIDRAANGTTVKLTDPISAGTGDTAITIPKGKSVILDLNGQAMDRQLSEKADGGSAIVVEQGATLTVRDSAGGGKITGGAATQGGGILNKGTLNITGGMITGNSADNGGGVYNAGKLTMSGGTIGGNTTSGWGGGIYLANGTGVALHLNGGRIESNTCGNNGGGVHVSETAAITASGAPVVTGNKKGAATTNNVNLAEGTFIVVTKALDADASIGVNMSQPAAGNITSGLKGKGGAANFAADDSSSYTVALDGGGEAYLSKEGPYTEVNTWTGLQEAINNASADYEIIKLSGDVVNTENKDCILVNGKTVTIDLNGYTVNRNRTSSDEDGHVFWLKGNAKLTIRDSAGGGTITGGYAKRGGGIHINEGCTCTISGGTITGNKASVDGGGIYVRGILKMTGGSIVRNYSDDTGGGIYVNSTGKINLTGVNISYNTTDDQGGGIKAHLAADSSITNCTISYNEADDDTGGAIHLDAKDKTLTITDSTIDYNKSDDDGGGIYLQNGTIRMSDGSVSNNYSSNDGGGVKVTGGTTFIATGVQINANTANTEEGGGVKNFGTATLTDCTISNNKSKKQGGGLYNDDDGGKGILTLENCTVTGNRSIHDNGGGIYSDYKLTLSACVVTGNAADIRGGGVFIGDDSKDTYIGGELVVKDNRAKVGGQDIFLRTHNLVVESKLTEKAKIGITKENDNGLGTFTRDYSRKNGGDAPSNHFFSPEGLEVEWGDGGEAKLASGWDDLRAQIKNAADGSRIVLDKNYTASKKGDYLEISKNKTLTIDMHGYTLNRNRSSKDGDGHVIWVKEGATLILEDSTATADEPVKGTITGGYSKRGGGIYVDENATCDITGVNVKENKASDDGAGIYVKGYLKATDCIISDNVADDNGGGIFSEDTGHVDLDRVTVTRNDCDNDGAGMKLWLSMNSTIKDSEISQNRSEDCGGGLYMDANGKKLTITNTKFDENECSDDGAGIFLNKGTIEMSGGSISKNEASNDSGGIKASSETTFTANNVQIIGNKAKGEEGGGVKNYGTTTLTNCTISNNSAGEHGGGVFNDNDGGSAGLLTVDGCTFTGNKSNDDGGAIYSDKKLVIKGSTEKPTTIGGSDENKNQASGGGGIKIGADSDETEISGAVVITNNDATRGPDLYLRKGQKLTLTGAITGTSIGVIDMDSIGVFTKDYSKYHPATDENGNDIAANNPVQFFCKGAGAIPCEWYEEEIDGNKVKTEVQLHSNWPELQAAIDAAAVATNEADHVVTLDKDYRAGSSDVQLKIEVNNDEAYKDVANNGHVTIDLNGHALNRNCWDDKKSGHVIQVYEGAVLTIKDSKASKDNLDENTGFITGGNADKGGAIYISEDATVNFESGTIASNRADGHGGGIFNKGDLNMTGGLVALNVAEDNGGAIYSTSTSTLSLDGVTISDNNAGDNGGGINICSENDATIKNCKIENNNAGDYGGGLRLDAEGCTLTIEDTKIEENASYDDGAGVYLRYGTIHMSGTTDGAATISNNDSANDAGGIKVTSKTVFEATNVTISGNRAALEEGGGIKTYGETTLTNCLIDNNKAKEQGGGIYNDNDGKSEGKLTLNNCTITNNTSENDGGGVYSDHKLTIIGSTIGGTKTVTNNGKTTVENLGNTAERGGGVYIGSGSKDTEVQGKVVIKDNKATVKDYQDDPVKARRFRCKVGHNLFLQKDRMLVVTGALTAAEGSGETANAEIHLDLEEGIGEFAKDYLKYYPGEDNVPSVDPATFFKAATGYAATVNKDKIVELTSGWKALKAEIESAKNGDTIVLYKDYAAEKSDDRIKIDEGKNITVDLNGHMINRNRSSEDKDGHVFEVLGTLTIKDSRGAISPDGSSVPDDSLKTGTITGGWAENGGGINIADTGTLNFEGGQVSENRAKEDGGGIYAHGTLNMTGGTVKDNKAEHNGGGIGLDDNSEMSLTGGTITENSADNQGGGIKVDEHAKVNIAGNPVVSGNKATHEAGDIYLPKLVSLNLTGELAEKTEGADGAKLCVALEEHRGAFTNGYSKYNADDDPAIFFKSTEGYEVQKKSGEAELVMSSFGKTDDADPFVSWKDQIDTNSEELSSYNWMAGVSGERYLHEINYPRTHDSAMNKIDKKDVSNAVVEAFAAVMIVVTVGYSIAAIVGTAGAATPLVLGLIAAGATVGALAMPNDYTSPTSWGLESVASFRAKTQTTYIYEQLENGARRLDLRLNNKKKVWKLITSDGYPNGWEYSDDGRNLYHCHGAKAQWGTYHALDPDGDYQSLDETLSWVKDFLTEHPTETIILNLTPETSKTGDLRTIRERTRTILEHSLLDINPSTGEAFLYKEPESDNYFAYYTRPPKLADCRGKVTIYTGTDMGYYTGGAGQLDIPQPSNGASFSEQPGKHMDSLRKGAAKLGLGEVDLPTDADTHLDFSWFWGTSCTGEDEEFNYVFTDAPYALAQWINPRLIGEGKLFDQEKLTGKYIGCLSMDDYQAEYGEVCWRTNFFDGLQYRTVKVESGLEGQDSQEFTLLKGTELTIPGNIYKNVGKGKYFAGWQADDGTIYNAGDTFKVSESITTFTAQWLEAGKVPVRVVWKDGDDKDGLRPDSVKLKTWVDDVRSDMTLSSGESWASVIEDADNKQVTLVPDFDLVTNGQYSYSVEFEDGAGYVVTLVHTPDATETISGKIMWDDDENVAGYRPQSVTVRLQKNGVEAQAQDITEEGDWSYSFEVPQYENGEKLSYSIDADSVEHYQSSAEDGTITYTYVEEANTLSVIGFVEWDDASDTKSIRPEKTTLTLVAGDKEVSTTNATLNSEDPWTFEFDDVPLYDDEGNMIDNYGLVPEQVPGYTVKCEAVTLYGEDDPTGDGSDAIESQNEVYFRVTYTLDPDQMEPAEVVENPQAREAVYTGDPQELIDKGSSTGGTMVYALGTDAVTAPAADAFAEALPTATDAGTYHVWYYVKGDVLHSDTEPACVETTIDKADQEIRAKDVEGFAGESGKVVQATLRGAKGATEGLGALGFEVTEGADVASVDATTGALTLLAPGTATVCVTAAETGNYNAASADVAVTVTYAMHTVTFFGDTEGTKVWQQVTLEDGVLLDDLAGYGTDDDHLLTREGYTLAGWATEPGIVVDSYKTKRGALNPALVGKLVDFSGAIAGDVDAYPIWIRDRLEVHLDGSGDEASPVVWGTGSDGLAQSDAFTVNIDEKIDMAGLNSTTREGYELDGWYTSGGVKWDEGGAWGVTPEYCDKDGDGNPVVQVNSQRRFKYYTVTLTARWTPTDPGQSDEPDGQSYTITFDSKGGSAVEPITQESGTAITLPEDPTKAHYKFAGWYPALPETMPNDNLEVEATWEPVTYYIAFYDGDVQLSVLGGAFGSVVEAPAVSAKPGSVFAGWNTKPDGTGGAVAFPMRMPDTGLMMVYAVWKIVQEPPAVSVEALDAYSVKVVDALDDAEYIIVPAGQEPSAKDWAGAKRADDEGTVVFGGLFPITSYDVWARMLETEGAAQSEAAKAVVTTAKEAQVAPEAPAIQVADGTTVSVVDPDPAQEYALVAKGDPVPQDGAEWVSVGEDGKVEWTGLAAKTEYSLHARYKETSGKAASAPSLVVAVKTGEPAAPGKGDLGDAIAAAEKAAEGIAVSEDGADVPASQKYVTAAEKAAFEEAMAAAQKVANDPSATQAQVAEAIAAAKKAAEDLEAAMKAGKKAEPAPAVGSTHVVGGSTYKVTSNDPAAVTFAKSGSAASVTVPDAVTIGGRAYPVTEIAPNAFAAARQKLASVTVGRNVKVIGESAFAGCANLAKVEGGSAVTIIKAKAFLGCKKLKKCAPFSSKVLVKVGKQAFKGCKKLKKLTACSKLLKKAAVKGSLKGSSVKTIKVKVGAKKLNKKFAKKYKKIFKKKNSGKKVKVKK